MQLEKLCNLSESILDLEVCVVGWKQKTAPVCFF